jgi:hypothetical protein
MYGPWSGPAATSAFGPVMSPDEEKQMLQEEVAFLKGHLDQISKRIEELEKESKGKN